MQIPLAWLKEYVAVEADAQEVGTRLTMSGSELEGLEESEIGPVLDVYITPNRGDCLSMVGVAREVAAVYNLPLKAPTPPMSEPGGETAAQTSVEIEAPDLCPRYAARLVRGVKIGPSPEWMQQRLEAAGQRPINNVVDVTNYVMLELGQPLHAFDLDRLAEGRIVVRRARPGETLQTLDGTDHALTSEMLVIADGEKAVALAGVMGGASSEVSDTTTNLLLESAHFHPLSVRRTARALGMRTEASYRFERTVDRAGVRRAVDRACELLAQIGQPEAVSGVVDTIAAPIEGRDVLLRVEKATLLLGMEITVAIAEDCLRRLGIGSQREADGKSLLVHVPPLRADLTLEEDLVEEIGRIYGYENIPETLPAGSTTQGGESELGSLQTRIRRLLVSCGLQEVVTHSLIAPPPYSTPEREARRIPMRNALSAEVSGLRDSLLPTLLDVAQHNGAYGQHALRLFEVGRVWHNATPEQELTPMETLSVGGLLMGALTPATWQKEQKPALADYPAIKGVVEQLLDGLGISTATFAPLGDLAGNYPQFHPGRTAAIRLQGGDPQGVVGELHPLLAAKYGLRERAYLFEIELAAIQAAMPTGLARFQPLGRFQAVVRDLAPRVAEEVSYAALERAVRTAEAPYLEGLQLTDLYRGHPLPEGVKSLTLSLTFRSPDKTLSETEIGEALDHIRLSLTTHCGASFLT